MRFIGTGQLVAAATGASLLMSVLVPSAAAARPIDVWFEPPRVIVRGETVILAVTILDGQRASGVAYIRPDSSRAFVRLPMTSSPGRDGLSAKVPVRLLAGSTLDAYVVVRIPGIDRPVTVPPTGAAGPYRSWIVDHPSTVKLGRHQFDRLRSPDAIVARADPGSGPGEVAFYCPTDGQCVTPRSFDIEADGTVWVADPANQRLLSWEADQPSRPSRSIPLEFSPRDLAIAPDHTILVRGVKPGAFASRLFAFDRDGRQLWWSDLASTLFNSHIRFGSDGVLYSVDVPWGPWVPVMDRSGVPVPVADQIARTRPDQPISGGRRLVVEGPREELPAGQLAPRDWRAAIATSRGSLRRAWRITSANDLDLSFEAVPAMVDGDPVLVFAVFRFADHTREYVVVRLAADGGVRDRFSLGRGGYRVSDLVTDVRVGADGRIYQLLSDPVLGLQIARFALEGPAPASATPTPTPTPLVSPNATPVPTPAATPTPYASLAALAPSPSSPIGPANATPSAASGEMLLVAVLGVAGLVGAVLAWWAFRRMRRPSGPADG